MSENLNPEQMQKIEEALAAGQKIDAIAVYREATGLGLAESKDAIEALQAKLKEQNPGKFASVPAVTKSGCGSIMTLGVAALVLVTWVLVHAA